MTSSQRSYVAVVGVLLLAACSGTSGAQGSQGPAGAQGSQGSTGPQGAQGAQGAQGLKGDQGIISSTLASGSLGPIPIVPQVVPGTPVCADGAGMEFLELWADVAPPAVNQAIHASASFDLGGTGGSAAGNLSLALCSQQVSVGGATVGVPRNEGIFLGDTGGGLPLEIPGNTRLTFSIAGVLAPDVSSFVAGDSVRVGPCGCIDNSGAWTPGFGVLIVQVIQTP